MEKRKNVARKKKRKKTVDRYFDYSLLFLIIFIVAFGLIIIYSASSYTAQMEFKDSAYYLKKQLLFSLLGMGVMFIFYMIDYRVWKKLAPLIFVASLLLIVAIIPFGSSSGGAKRWIRFLGIGVQPADVSKLAVIMMIAAAVCNMGTKLKKFRYVILICAVTAGTTAALIYVISNNMSSALIILMIAVVMTFVAYPGYKIYVAFTAAFGAGVCGLYMYIANVLKHGGMTGNFRKNRLLVWINPEEYAADKGYQTVQALYAIGSGGLFGKGLGKSLQKLGYIPESQNDMIFSIVCEELGLFGALVVIVAFAIMLWRIAHIAQNAPDLFGTMLAVGVFAHIAIQVVLNIAVVTNFIPNTGVSLPFISYGGTSTVVLLAEMGIVLNISSKIRLER